MPPSAKDKFGGTWKLVSAEFRRPDGDIIYSYGKHPVGVFMYDANGTMSVQIMRSDRPAFASGDLWISSREELKAALEGYVAYFGTYEVDEEEAVVTHRIEGSWFPNWVGTEQKRFFEFSGDRLILRTPEARTGTATVTGELVWQRAE